MLFFLRSCKKLLTLNLRALTATWPTWSKEVNGNFEIVLKEDSKTTRGHDVFSMCGIFFFPDVEYNFIPLLEYFYSIPGKNINFIPHASIPPVEYFYSARGIVLNR